MVSTSSLTTTALALTGSSLAQKYKEYNKLRAIRPSTEPFSQSSATPSYSPSTKRKRDDTKLNSFISSLAQLPINHPARNPSPTPASTPRHQRVHPAALDPYDSPHQVQATPTAARTSIGPTPQRNGFALGLFDLLTPSKPALVKQSGHQGTPSHVHEADLEVTPCKKQRTAPHAISEHSSTSLEGVKVKTPVKCLATPTRARVTPGRSVITPAKTSATPVRHSRTPPSTGRRYFLDAFLQTPTARRLGLGARTYPFGPRNGETRVIASDTASTPSSRKRGAAAARLGLAKVADEAEAKENHGEYAEKLELSFSPVKIRLPPKPIGRPLSELVRGLRNMEEERMDEELDLLREMEAEENDGAPKSQNRRAVGAESIESLEPPIDGDENCEAGIGTGQQGQERKMWKKKGQKRTTRNVRIQPSTAKWKPEPEWKGGVESDSEGQDAEQEDDAEFSLPPEKQEDEKPNSQSRNKDAKRDKRKPGRPPKMIAATANPNFRALKIKNKNSRAKRGRFGRR